MYSKAGRYHSLEPIAYIINSTPSTAENRSKYCPLKLEKNLPINFTKYTGVTDQRSHVLCNLIFDPYSPQKVLVLFILLEGSKMCIKYQSSLVLATGEITAAHR